MKSDTEAESDIERYCPLCWRPIPPDVDYCPVCNVKAETDTSATNPTPLTLAGATATVASLICIFGALFTLMEVYLISDLVPYASSTAIVLYRNTIWMFLAITLFDFIGLVASLTAGTNARERRKLTQTIAATGLLLLTGILNLIAADPDFNTGFSFGMTNALAFGVPITVLAVLMLASVAARANEFTNQND